MAEACDSIEAYLEYVGRLRSSPFGRQFRRQFRDTRGTAELAMLAAPSPEEYEDFCRLVAALTESEKAVADRLTDEQVRGVAQRAGADNGHAAIFFNGYALKRKMCASENPMRD